MASPTKPRSRSSGRGEQRGARFVPALALSAALMACPVPAAATQGLELGTYEVTVNTRRVEGVVFVARDANGRLYVDEAALRAWRIRLPTTERVQVDGMTLVPLDAIPGTRHRIEERLQAIDIAFAPEHLRGSTFAVDSGAGVPAVRMSPWGGFLNYSLFGYASSAESYGSALLEGGVFGPSGTGIATFGLNTAATAGRTREAVRLDTMWRRDDPATLRTLVVGDTISRAGFFGRPVRLGGIQYGSNFSLQPGYVTTPLLAFSGTAAVPSTVDVFVNNQRVASQTVELGPFSVTNVPRVSGSGSVQLVVRDAFGQQQVLAQSFYGSPALLAAGLDDFAVALGAQRRNYGLDSFDYGDAQASLTWRRGLTDRATAELRAEADGNTRSAGVAIDMLVGDAGIASVGVAASDGPDASGGLLMLGFERQARSFSFGVRGTLTGAGFRQVGDDALFVTPERSIAAHAALSLGRYGSVGAAWVTQRYHEPASPPITTGTITHSVGLGTLGSLSVSVSRVEGTRSGTAVFAVLSVPFGAAGTTASASTNNRLAGAAGPDRQAVAVQRSLPAYGDGYGFSLYADSDRRAEAGIAWSASRARVRAEIGRAHDSSAARATIEGGIGALGGHVFLARPIVESFALARAGGLEGLPVMQENQPVGRTDRDGLLVLTPLRAYQANLLSIDPLGAPIGVGIRSPAQKVVPMWRSGVVVDFDVRRGRSALVRLQLDDGRPVPSSAKVFDAGNGDSLPVGLDGEVFIAGLPDSGTRLVIEWNSTRCEIDVAPQGDEPVQDLGPLRCGEGRL